MIKLFICVIVCVFLFANSFGQKVSYEDLIGGSWHSINTNTPKRLIRKLEFFGTRFLLITSPMYPKTDSSRIFYSIEELSDMSVLQIGSIPYLIKKIDKDTYKQQGLYTNDKPRVWDNNETIWNTTIFKRDKK